MAGNSSDRQMGGNTRFDPSSTHGGANTATAILRLPSVLKMRGRSRSAHYLDIKEGLFTRPVSVGSRAVGWPEHELEAINAARIAGKSDEEIRVLVTQLEAARKALA